MTVEIDKYVNATTDTRTPKWGTVGANPWLDAGDASYISSAGNNFKSGDYSFPNSAGGGSDIINSVKLRFKDRIGNINGMNTVDVYVYDGTSWSYAGSLAPSWILFQYDIDIDVSAILNSWAKINAANVYVQLIRFDGYAIAISELIRVVDYTPSAAAPTTRGDGLTWIICMLKRRLPRFRYATKTLEILNKGK